MSGGMILAAMASDGQASPSISIISYPSGEIGNASNLSGSGRSANMPISDEAPKGGGKVRPSHHG